MFRVKAVDDQLRDHAFGGQSRNPSRAFVLLDHGDRVVGYDGPARGGVRRKAVPPR